MVKNIIAFLLLVGIVFPVNSQALPGFMEERMGTMTGQVIYEGKPLANNLLAFFNVNKGLPPIAGQGGRAPDARTYSDQEGKFSLRLSLGSYYVGVLRRGPEEPLGPPRQGELYYFAGSGEGKLRRISLESRSAFDSGVIEVALPENFLDTEDYFVVSGEVVNGAGDNEPYQGAMVTAKYGNTSRYRPDYVSRPTGADGKFSLRLPPGKSFILLARSSITGNKPKPGDDIGKYGANSFEPQVDDISQLGPPPGVNVEKPVKVASNEQVTVKGESGQIVSGVVIHMYKMPDQKVMQESIKAENQTDTDAPDYYKKGAALKNLLFATNSVELQGEFAEELEQWVKFLQGNTSINIELSGYTDNVGSVLYNQQLSEKRAQVVGTYLINKGVDPARVSAAGYGKANPVADNNSAEGRSKNRRVMIQFIR